MNRSVQVGSERDVYAVGPLPLDSGERTLLWMVKAGQMVLGSVRLQIQRSQVAELAGLQLFAPDEANQQSHGIKLMCAVTEYARDHGILKLSVNEDSRRHWLPQQLLRLGFHDAQRSGEDMEFYLDLYTRPLRRRDQRAPRSEVSMAC